MELKMQSACHGFPTRHLVLASPSQPILSKMASARPIGFRHQIIRFRVATPAVLKGILRESSLLNLRKRLTLRASNSNPDVRLDFHDNETSHLTRYHGTEPFRGKSGSVSFHGLTHHLMEEGRLESTPFEGEKGSLLWILAPLAFISSLILPQFFLGNAIEALLKDETVVEIVTSLTFESLFYVGLATFLVVADRVQRPYLQYSTKRWGLITGLRGYLASAFFTMGFKVIAPIFLVCVTWPVLSLPALVAVTPFLVGCAAQYAFEKCLDKRESSCWPLIPIIFEVYRLYQLTRAAHFIEKLMFAMRELPNSPQVLERGGALFTMIVSFQVLGLVCLWSLMTFLLRLFPSRPVAEKY